VSGSASGTAAPPARSRALPGLLFAGLVVLLYADPLFSGRNFVGRDLLAYNLPLEKSVHDAWARGRLPVWTPEVSGGRPLLPNPNAGALYPVRALLAAAPFPLAMRIYPILHWIAAGLGAMALLTVLGRSRGAAWAGAATYVFSGVSVSEVFFPHIQPGMTLLPCLLWAAARRWPRPAWQTLALALLFTLDFLAADVFTGALAIFAVALWIGLEAGPERRKAFGRLAAALFLAILFALPQIVATALWIPETSRAVLGMKVAEVTHFSVSPWRLVELIVPYPFGETWRLDPSEVWGWGAFGRGAMGLFTTLYAGALAAIGLSAWRARARGAAFARWLLPAALVLLVAPSLLPARFGGLASPLALRHPEKFAVALVLGLSILAAILLDRLREPRGSLRGAIVVAALLAAVAGAALLFPRSAGSLAARWLGGASPKPQAASGQLPRALAEGALLWGGTLAALALWKRPARSARAAALVLLTAGPILATRRIPLAVSEAEAFGPTPFARWVEKEDPEGAFRTLGESIYSSSAEAGAAGLGWAELPRESWIYDTSVFWGRGTVFNYDFDAGDLARVESLRRLSSAAFAFPQGPAFFGNLSLKFGVRRRGQAAAPGFHAIGGNAAQTWDLHDGALPDIRLATRWREEPGALAAAARIRGTAPGELLLETGRRGDGEAPAGTLRVLEKTPERLILETETSRPAWLFVLRAFWSHRDVRVDGTPVETVPAYLAYTAVPVPGGRRRIEWEERVPGGDASRFGPLAAGIGVALLAVSARRTIA
jgi:hypothetical protein